MLVRDAIHPTPSELRALIVTASRPVIVEVGAERCFPCKKLRPFLRKFATELNNAAIVVAIDTIENKTFAREWQIETVPQLLLFRNGALSGRIRGFERYETVRKAIGNFLGSAAPATASSAETAFGEAVTRAEAALGIDLHPSSEIIDAIWEPLAPVFEVFVETQKAALAAGRINEKEYDELLHQEMQHLFAPFRMKLNGAFKIQDAAIETYVALIDKAVEAFACSAAALVETNVQDARFCLPGDPTCRIS
jgi:thioredoxin-like negative regulator of GroEL